jgi:hypothetical protein
MVFAAVVHRDWNSSRVLQSVGKAPTTSLQELLVPCNENFFFTFKKKRFFIAGNQQLLDWHYQICFMNNLM